MTFVAACVCFVLMNLKEKQNKIKRIVLETEEKMRQKCAIKINFKYEILLSCTFETFVRSENGENKNKFPFGSTHYMRFDVIYVGYS